MTDSRPLPAATGDGVRDQPGPDRIAGAALQMGRSDDLEGVLTLASTSIGEVLSGEAVLRLITSEHDLHASASGIVPPTALAASARQALSEQAGAAGGLLLESRGRHAECRVWVDLPGAPPAGAPRRTIAELLLHSLAQAVDRIVTVDRFRRSEANLARAVESHRLVGQAMGILIERHRILSEEAFDVLRRASQEHNVKLREVAQRVIETGSEPGEVV